MQMGQSAITSGWDNPQSRRGGYRTICNPVTWRMWQPAMKITSRWVDLQGTNVDATIRGENTCGGDNLYQQASRQGEEYMRKGQSAQGRTCRWDHM